MRIFDAHTHVIETLAGFGPRGELRAIGGGKARWANGDVIEMIPDGMGDRSFHYDTLAQLLRDQGVEKAVLLQGSFYGFQNDFTREAARKYPDLFLPSGTFDPFCARAGELLDQLLDTYHLSIIKFELSSGGGLMGYHRAFPLDGDVLDGTIARIAQAGATLVLDIGSPGMESFQPEAVAAIAKKYASMQIVVCHLLAPTLQDEAALTRALGILNCPNICFDLAALPWNVYPEAYPYPTALRYLAIAKKIVGADKLIWGTDVPSVLTRERYQKLADYIVNSGLFTEEELEKIFWSNACRAYHVEPVKG